MRTDAHTDDAPLGSFWHALVDDYRTYGPADHVVFMSNGSQDGTSVTWQPPFGSNYNDGLTVIERAMTKADAAFPNYDVVFGGVVWNLSPGLGGVSGNPYPFAEYRTELDDLLAHFEDDVVANYPGARFYFISTVIPRENVYPGYDPSNPYHKGPEVTFALDLEADACAEYAFCSMVQASDYIKRQQQKCIEDGDPYGDLCGGGYNSDTGDEGNGPHWGQGGMNHIGHTAGPVIAAHGPQGSGSPFSWELAVEVPQPIAWCASPPAPCPNEVPALRLDVYDDADTLIKSDTLVPSLANPDWRADFDGSDAGADWVMDWDSLTTDFLTLEVVREGGGASTETLARYAYVPTAVAYGTGQTGFFRPDGGGAALAAHIEVFPDDSVKARAQHTAGLYFEDAFEGGADAYVVPYNRAYYKGVCGAGCPAAAADFFLARLPLEEPRPDGTLRRFTFADEADTPIPSSWGSLTWSADSLVLAFPAGRRLVVNADLAATGVVLTAAGSSPWGGVAVYSAGSLDFEGVTVTGAEVGIEVRSQGNAFTDVLLDGNGVGILTGLSCPNTGCTGSEPRSSFTLAESCVTGSDVLIGDGYGIWARHTDATISASTVQGNGAYGLFVDEADVGAYRLLLQLNGGDSGSEDGARIDPGGDLTLTDLYALLGQNKIVDNVADELFVEDNGYATVGISNGSSLRNHLAYGGSSTSGFIVDNEDPNTTIPALLTYWGDPNGPPAGSIDGLVNVSMWLNASPSGSAGHPNGCTGAGADFGGGGGLIGGSSPGQGDGHLRGTGGASPAGSAFQDPEPRTMDPEAAAWFRAHVDSLRLALAAAPDSPGLVRALYAAQRLDRDDDLGERAATMGMLATLRGGLLGGAPLTESERAAGEAALVSEVHDALRAGRYAEAGALLAPFHRDPDPLPEIEGEAARWTLALALVALDEQAGEVASAIARIEAVLAELGPEEEALARDLAATAAMLARRLEGEGAGGQGYGGTAQTRSGDLPSTYALGQPYPNPFGGSGRSPQTTVPFALPEDARVTVTVYDLLGRRVAVLADAVYEAGRHVAVLDGRGLASGVYVVRAEMEADRVTGNASGTTPVTRSFTRRITLIRR